MPVLLLLVLVVVVAVAAVPAALRFSPVSSYTATVRTQNCDSGGCMRSNSLLLAAVAVQALMKPTCAL